MIWECSGYPLQSMYLSIDEGDVTLTYDLVKFY